MQHAATVLVALGALVLTAWTFDWPLAATLSDRWPAMQPWTAISFVALGVAMRWWRGAAWVAAFASGATLLQYLSGVDLSIDRTFFAADQGPEPGRMAINTAACVLLAACALLQRGPRVRGWIGAIIVATSGVALSGYVLGVEEASRWADGIGMALHTSLGLLITAGWLIQSARLGSWRSAPTLALAGSTVVGLECLRTLVALDAPPVVAWGSLILALFLGALLSALIILHRSLAETVRATQPPKGRPSQPPEARSVR